jgi:hypothetical protein
LTHFLKALLARLVRFFVTRFFMVFSSSHHRAGVEEAA